VCFIREELEQITLWEFIEELLDIKYIRRGSSSRVIPA
jgi:hypothetical protein